MTLKTIPIRPGPAQHADPDILAHARQALRAAQAPQAAPVVRAPDTPVQDCFTDIGAPQYKVGRVGAAAGAVTLPPPCPSQIEHRRITAVHLPDFAMERWVRWSARHSLAPPQDMPVALSHEGPHGPVVYATNAPARSAGVHPGARIVDMRALCPDLRVKYADIGGDHAALHRLMLWARRWCPWTAVDGDAGLVLDTTGSDHLWGGEAVMLRDIEARLANLGLSSNLACAPTHGAAWALARLGGVREICDTPHIETRMGPMPVKSLRIDGQTVQLLQRLGLKTVGDLAAVPRISLARRFSKAALGQNPLLRLDQMMGRTAEPLSARHDPPRFAVQAKLPEPIQDPTPHLLGLCEMLCTSMEKSGVGARRITVTVYRTDGDISHVTVATAQPSRSPQHLHRLFDDKLDRIDPGFGFDLITLAANGVEALKHTQTDLSGRSHDGAAIAQLIDKLSARLGAKYVTRITPAGSHIPERAETWREALQKHAPDAPAAATPRPLKIFDHPEEVRVLYAVPEGPPAQFVWRKITHRVVRYAGPERIAPEWWKDMPSTRLRDYYDIENQKAQRIWLFREGVWGDTRGTDPRWFIHGTYA